MIKIYLLLVAFLIPGEFDFVIGELRLSPFRIFLLGYGLALIASWHKRSFRWHAADSVALLTFIWPTIALLINSGLAAGIESGGILFLEMAIPYFMVRMEVREYRHLKAVAVGLFSCATILLVLGLPETIFGQYFVREFAGVITGNTFNLVPDVRLGLYRAIGPTDHPIFFGTVCAVGLAIALRQAFIEPRYWLVVFVILGGTFISLSSGPLLTAVAQVGLLAWARIAHGQKYKWLILSAIVLVLYVTIDFLSNRDPFRVMFTYLLFSEHNGYIRYYMWTYSLFLANQSFFSMLFGYGLSTEMFELLDSSFFQGLMSRSIDAYWMVILIRYGWPMLILHLCFVFLAVFPQRTLSRKARIPKSVQEAWLISAIAFTLVGCAVHFWGQMVSLYMMVVALALCAATMRMEVKERDEAGNTLATAQPSLTR